MPKSALETAKVDYQVAAAKAGRVAAHALTYGFSLIVERFVGTSRYSDRGVAIRSHLHGADLVWRSERDK